MAQGAEIRSEIFVVAVFDWRFDLLTRLIFMPYYLDRILTNWALI